MGFKRGITRPAVHSAGQRGAPGINGVRSLGFRCGQGGHFRGHGHRPDQRASRRHDHPVRGRTTAGPWRLRVGHPGRERIDARRGTVALCRCGKSALKPFCDGTHKAIDFRAGTTREG
ncbi:CDGSH iron-sulfur domain-containing protein [Micromonospora tarensis]|uniref:CDGSH iron-sulfur domain-containing protein n=1 Tax=Micromonospora tarensis TaxID=2806100 RepID=UPI001EE48EBC|nr:CDGSH iron-sulfur domain-containing protein [Micromonospora tarensis]